MGDIHRLIADEGLANARAQATTSSERRAVEAAATVLSEEISRLRITHAGFAMTALPHRRIDETVWERKSHLVTLLVESGLTRQKKPIGEIGKKSRLCLVGVGTTPGNPEVTLGRSMNAWLMKMAITSGGKTRELVSEQVRRIASCRLTFFEDKGPAEQRTNSAFIQRYSSLAGMAGDAQLALWQDKVRLDEGFWKSLQEHPVPVREEAIQAIGMRSMSIDIYIWLAYRLHCLPTPLPITWQAIYSQFGAGFAALRHFKPRFSDCLKVALAVYPEANVEVLQQGLKLHPSPPAVSKSEAKRLGLI